MGYKKEKNQSLTSNSGQPPGYVEGMSNGDKKARLHCIRYDAEHLEEFKDLTDLKIDEDMVNWLNVDLAGDSKSAASLGKSFQLHPLMVEDIFLTDTRVKYESYEDKALIVMKMLYLPEDGDVTGVESEQISIVLGKNYVLTFQERAGDVFSGVRKRLRGSMGRIRSKGPDYLAYALMDAVVDSYFSVLEAIGDRVSFIEEKLMGSSDIKVEEIHLLKRELISLRRAIWPVRELIRSFEREGVGVFREETLVFLHDLHDNVINAIDTVETFREVVSGLNDLYLSSLSNRMNEVMKVLTLIATLFIPITFIAGVYGMNFKYIPEMDFKYSYPIFWICIVVIVGGMLIYFKKKKWF